MKFDTLSLETRERVKKVQTRLDELGVRDMGFTFNPDFERTEENFEKFANDICTMIECYLDGNYTVMPDFGDGTERLDDLNDM